MLSETLLLFMVAPCLFVFGFVLIWRGWRVSRSGDIPHCGNCEYNLTGLESDRCPECGSLMTADSVAYGKRYRRPGLIVVGLLCFLPALFLGGVLIGQVNWYQIKPTGWVIDDIQSAGRPVADNGWKELDRRVQAGVVSDRQMSRLVDLSLTQQGRVDPTFPLTLLMNHLEFLGTAHASGIMTEEQVETFFGQMMNFKLEVRPKVVLGDKVPFRVHRLIRCPEGLLWIKIVPVSSTLDGQKIRSIIGASGCGGGSGSGWSGSRFPCPGPGVHTIEHHLVIKVFSCAYDEFGETDIGELLYERNETISDEFEVLAEEPTDYIKIVDDPALRQELYDAINPKEFRHIQLYLEGDVEIGSLPINVAFDVLIRMDELIAPVGTIVRARGDSTLRQYFLWSYDELPFDRTKYSDSFDLILRSNEKLVRETVDMTEAWQGELIYEDIPVEFIPAAGSGQSPK